MKKVLFYISIVLAILSAHSICAKSADSEFGFRLVQNNFAFYATQPSADNLVFDAILEDFSDDDSDDSENEKDASANVPSRNTSLNTQNQSESPFKNVLSPNFFFPRKTSLHILLCVFRI